MDLNTLINVTISAASPAITKIGFGEPGLYGYVTAAQIPLSSRSRRYSSSTGLSDMVTDGFAVTDPLYLAAVAVLSQSPRPPTFKILAGRLEFQHDFELLPTTDATGELLEFTLTKGALSITYSQTAAGGGVAAESTALAGTINGDATSWGTAGTNEFVCAAAGNPVTFDAVTPAGDNDIWYISNLTNIAVSDVSVTRGVTADLGAIITADPDWYELIPADSFGADELEDLAAVVQSATNKVMSCATQDAVVIAGTGIGQVLSLANQNRSSVYFSKHSMSQYPAAASAGRFLPEFPGTIARMYKSLSGVTPSQLTAAESAFAHADFVNTYEGIEIGGVTVVSGNLYKGWTSGSSETFMDTIRLIDALVAEVQTKVLSVFRGSRKVPFTDIGVGQIKGSILAAIKVFMGSNPPGLTPGSEFCNVPRVADISAINKAARNLPNVSFGAEIAGAIATVVINGTLEY